MPKNKRVTYATNFRETLVKAAKAHENMIKNDYDKGFQSGLRHAIYLLDQDITAYDLINSYIESSERPEHRTRRKVSVIISKKEVKK